MRLPHFNERCPHVKDHLITLNGGRINVDHYLKVLRARALLDPTVLGGHAWLDEQPEPTSQSNWQYGEEAAALVERVRSGATLTQDEIAAMDRLANLYADGA